MTNESLKITSVPYGDKYVITIIGTEEETDEAMAQIDSSKNPPDEYEVAIGIARRMRANGKTIQAIANLLNEAGYCDRSGKPYDLESMLEKGR